MTGLRGLLAAALVTSAAGATAGCGLGLDDVPLPDLVEGPTYSVTLEFIDALNLPIDAPVKLEGATVGQVTEIEAGAYVAEVEVALSESVELRTGSRAEIRLTSPMGTAFVELFPARRGLVMAEGDVLPATATGTAPDVTDLLSALSTVVTGGSFDDISTIITQLNVALTGNAGDVRLFLGRLDRAVTDLASDLPLVDRLTAAVGRLSSRLASDLPVITRSLVDLTDLVESFEAQRSELVAALDALRRFDAVATPFTRTVRADLLAQLEDMRPVVQTLLDGRQDIDGIMNGLIAFASGSDRAAPGDYVNFDLTFLADLEALLQFHHGDEPPVDPDIPERGGAR
ncbi:phospholipid/cholesterol/gamma-HCH transport system substrate-binding protein [Nocardioides thalensis]|uniref:Phospholipid/cholesterol/gamma-HCH transport system substrate-binding protein n=1 Tax=Nocardioides thalensis TaxID=1914755 RepID=A0A853C9J0_9ACTN|nr:phospholipid/cholesterol/gamma-HCH transport system substrate-binding protein [Nocardioides thalensis]